jgi:hypothetical protein
MDQPCPDTASAESQASAPVPSVSAPPTPVPFTIYVPTAGSPRIQFVGSLLSVQGYPGLRGTALWPGCLLSFQRTECAEHFLADDSLGDYLLFIDDDIEFNASALDALFAAATQSPSAIFGGVYWAIGPDTTSTRPVAFDYAPHPDTGLPYHAYIDSAVAASATAPYPVDAIGTGFLAIPRDTLRVIRDHCAPDIPFPLRLINGVVSGEDLNFCHIARSLSIPIYAVPLDIGHVKTTIIRSTSSPLHCTL